MLCHTQGEGCQPSTPKGKLTWVLWSSGVSETQDGSQDRSLSCWGCTWCLARSEGGRGSQGSPACPGHTWRVWRGCSCAPNAGPPDGGFGPTRPPAQDWEALRTCPGLIPIRSHRDQWHSGAHSSSGTWKRTSIYTEMKCKRQGGRETREGQLGKERTPPPRATPERECGHLRTATPVDRAQRWAGGQGVGIPGLARGR